MPTPAHAEIIFHGYRYPDGRAVIVMETPDGKEIGPVRHVVRHSPTGLSWGYDGSGPADTARSLLLAALGTEARCKECGGSGRVVHIPAYEREEETASAAAQYGQQYGQGPGPGVPGASGAPLWPEMPRCRPCDCEDGYRQVPHQRFKREFVAGWGLEWHISRTDVLAWLLLDAAL